MSQDYARTWKSQRKKVSFSKAKANTFFCRDLHHPLSLLVFPVDPAFMTNPMSSFKFPVDSDFSGIPRTLYVLSMLTRPISPRQLAPIWRAPVFYDVCGRIMSTVVSSSDWLSDLLNRHFLIFTRTTNIKIYGCCILWWTIFTVHVHGFQSCF